MGKAELAAHLGLDTDEVGRALDALFELRLMRRSLGTTVTAVTAVTAKVTATTATRAR